MEENRTVSAGAVGQDQVANFIKVHCKHDSVPRNAITKSVNPYAKAREVEEEKKGFTLEFARRGGLGNDCHFKWVSNITQGSTCTLKIWSRAVHHGVGAQPWSSKQVKNLRFVS